MKLPPTFKALKPGIGADKKASLRSFCAAVKMLGEEDAFTQSGAAALKCSKPAFLTFNNPEPVSLYIYNTAGQLVGQMDIPEVIQHLELVDYPARGCYFHTSGIKHNDIFEVLKF